MATYKGFSFKNWQHNKSFKLNDVELVKQNLKNHIFTDRGSRVGQRGFGTNIKDLLFEPFTDNLVVLISDQVREVISYDPRVVLQSGDDYRVVPDHINHKLHIAARLFFVELDLTDILQINLEFES